MYAHLTSHECLLYVLRTHQVGVRMGSTLRIKPLVVADRLIQAAQVSPGQFLTVTREGIQLWRFQEGELVRLSQLRVDDALLLLLPCHAQDRLTAALVSDSQPRTEAWACRVVWLDRTGLTGRAMELITPHGQQNEHTFSRESQPSCSNAIHSPVYPNLTIGAVCAYRGCVHVYATSCDVNARQQDSPQAMYDFAAVAAAADPYQEGRAICTDTSSSVQAAVVLCAMTSSFAGECYVHATAFMPVSEETKSRFFSEKTLFLVCLVSYTGGLTRIHALCL